MDRAEEKARFKRMVPLRAIQVPRLGSWTGVGRRSDPPSVLAGVFWNEAQYAELRGSFAKVVVHLRSSRGERAGQLMKVVCLRPVEEAPSNPSVQGGRASGGRGAESRGGAGIGGGVSDNGHNIQFHTVSFFQFRLFHLETEQDSSLDNMCSLLCNCQFGRCAQFCKSSCFTVFSIFKPRNFCSNL